MENVRELPLSIQDFEKLRTSGCLYVDKTRYVYELSRKPWAYFLGRPRRFGKSLMLTTLKEYFLGKKALFEGLAIAELEKDWIEYPVFHIDMNLGSYLNLDSLYSVLNTNLKELEAKWGKDDSDLTPESRFRSLIRRAREQTGRKVVVLIDEYDKPLLGPSVDLKDMKKNDALLILTLSAFLAQLGLKNTGTFSNRSHNEHPHKHNFFGLSRMLFILFIYLSVSCNKKEESLPLNVIPLASAVGTYNILNLSDYVSDIRYISLETNDSILVGDIRLINYENKKILIKDSSQECYLFDNEGKLCNKIGQKGQGPNDYIFIQQVFLFDNFLFLADQFKILVYDTSGYIVKKNNLRPIYEEYDGLGNTIPLKKDTFLMDIYSGTQHYPKAIMFETLQSDAKIVREYPNHLILNKTRPGNYGFEMGFLYRFEDEIRIFKGINDTVFTVGQNTEMKAAFIFESGKYKPTIAFLERKEDSNNYGNYISPDKIYESLNHLYIDFWFGNHAPEPHKYSINGRQGIKRNVFGVFDKNTGELKLMRQPIKGKFGFNNDIDNGPVIWPMYISSENELVTVVSAEEFLEYFEKTESPSPQMTEIAKSLSCYDNPIVIIAKFK